MTKTVNRNVEGMERGERIARITSWRIFLYRNVFLGLIAAG